MPTGGYRIKLNELTDGGYYTCHSSMDTSSQYDIHFHISMKCKFESIFRLNDFHTFKIKI